MSIFYALQHNAVFFYGVVAFLGLFVGSFLNVVIYRLPVMMQNDWQEAMEEIAAEEAQAAADAAAKDANAPDQSSGSAQLQDTTAGNKTNNAADSVEDTTAPAKEKFNLSVPRSRCQNCSNLITWWQNLPVLSYLMLGGKCHNCKTPISPRYPIVELVTMLLCLVVAWQFGPTIQCVLGIIVTWYLVAMTMIDFDHHLLPDSLTLPLMWIGLVASLFPIFADVRSAVIGAACGYMLLWLVFQSFKFVTGKEGMGFGDFKLLAALGALLGWQQLPMIVLISSMVGAVVGISLILIAGRDKNIPIPFGPYLATAGWIAMLWGDQIWHTYMGTFA